MSFQYNLHFSVRGERIVLGSHTVPKGDLLVLEIRSPHLECSSLCAAVYLGC